MPYRQIKGVMHVTMAVPFEVTDYQDSTLENYSAEDWMRQVNDGTLPDWMEGQDIPAPDHRLHECVDWTVESAEYATASTEPEADQ
jgi:hypothetical protein